MRRQVRGHASLKIIESARAHRRIATATESLLWDALRDRRLAGLKFRREHPHGRFILDLFCVEHQLAVEIDGPIHTDAAQAGYDLARTEYLERLGIRVLRFTNAEVENDLDGILKRILAATKDGKRKKSG